MDKDQNGDCMKFEIHKIKGLNQRQEDKIRRAISLAEHVTELHEWKRELLTVEMTETNGMSNLQIMNLFFSGSDLVNKEADGDIDLFISGYFKLFSKVIGYVIKGSLWHWINKKYVDLFNEASLAGHLIHEYMHRVCFSHNFKKSTSVPYVYGNVTAKIAQKEIDNGYYKST